MADSKHTVGELRQLQSLPLRLKIPLTRQRIRDWYEHWDVRVVSVEEITPWKQEVIERG